MMGAFDWAGEMTIHYRRKPTETTPVSWSGKTFSEVNVAADALVDSRLAVRGVAQVAVVVQASGKGNFLSVNIMKGK